MLIHTALPCVIFKIVCEIELSKPNRPVDPPHAHEHDAPDFVYKLASRPYE